MFMYFFLFFFFFQCWLRSRQARWNWPSARQRRSRQRPASPCWSSASSGAGRPLPQSSGSRTTCPSFRCDLRRKFPLLYTASQLLPSLTPSFFPSSLRCGCFSFTPSSSLYSTSIALMRRVGKLGWSIIGSSKTYERTDVWDKTFLPLTAHNFSPVLFISRKPALFSCLNVLQYSNKQDDYIF